MNYADMQKGRFSTVQPPISTTPVSTGNLERTPHTPPYINGEHNLQLSEPTQAYSLNAKRYAAKYGIKLALNMESALLERNKGEITMTIREVDISARLGIPLDKDFFHKALQAIGGMVVEGIPGEPDNPYYLRAFYNRGIKFKTANPHSRKSDYDHASPAKQERADAAMREILAKLETHKLTPWPEEIENGFPQELCKPEYMTWDQFYKAQAAMTRRYASGENQHEPDTIPLTGSHHISSVPDGINQAEHSDSAGVSRTD